MFCLYTSCLVVSYRASHLFRQAAGHGLNYGFELIDCRFKRWKTEPLFKTQELRKGELWMSMHRRHAGMVVGDVTFYRKFKADCRNDCVLDEEYVQTLLHCLDPKVRILIINNINEHLAFTP